MGQAGPPEPRCTLLHCRWRGARPVCGCARCAGSACCAAARSTFWSATCAAPRAGARTAAPARPRAAPGRCRRPTHGAVSRWSCSSPGSARTRSPSSSRPCSGLPTRPARWAPGGSARCPRWGCLLYAAFCLSTARLAVQAQPAQTAQSEQRQDTGVDRGAAANRVGPRAPDPGGGPRRGRPGWRRAAGQSGSTSGSGSPQSTCPGRWPSLTRALGAVGCVARAVVFVLVGVFLLKAAVLSSAKQAKGLERGLPLGGRHRLRLLAAGRARVRPCVLRPVLPARSPLPRPDTGPLRRRRGSPPRPRLRATRFLPGRRRETLTVPDRGQRSAIPEEILVPGRRPAGVPGPAARTSTARPPARTDGPRPAGRASRRAPSSRTALRGREPGGPRRAAVPMSQPEKPATRSLAQPRSFRRSSIGSSINRVRSLEEPRLAPRLVARSRRRACRARLHRGPRGQAGHKTEIEARPGPAFRAPFPQPSDFREHTFPVPGSKLPGCFQNTQSEGSQPPKRLPG